MTSVPASVAEERHYTVAEVAAIWRVSGDTVRKLFFDDPAVIAISMPRKGPGERKHKPHVSLRIPASALRRVHDQQSSRPGLERKRRGRKV